MWIEKLLILIVAAVLCTTVNGANCGEAFRGKCSCGKGYYLDRDYYLVNCTNTGFRDTEMLENMPSETQVLIFTGNNIPKLPWNVFGAPNGLENLLTVDLSNNHIREIQGKSFSNVQNVKRLILDQNDLSVSKNVDDVNHHHPRVFSNFVNLEELHLTNAFADNTSAELSEDLHNIFVNSKLTKLTELHLEQNEIRNFNNRRVFCDLPSLRDLYLGENQLETINFNVVCLKHLRFLDLGRNKFTQMKLRDLNLLDVLDNSPGRDTDLTIDLTDNPLQCDCTVNNIQDWLKKTNVTIRDSDSLKCYKIHHAADLVLSLNTSRCQKQNTHVAFDFSKRLFKVGDFSLNLSEMLVT